MAMSKDEVTFLMDLLKIPVENRNFMELCSQIQNLIEEKENFKRFYLSKNDNSLEKILNNPGLQHLAEKIFDNLNFEYLAICRGINESSKQILDYQMNKPIFILRKFSGISQQNQKDWIEVIQSANNSEKEKAIASYLEWSLKKNVLVDLPCYLNPTIQNDFKKIIYEICLRGILSDEDTEIVKILAPLTDNLNAQYNFGNTPIYFAAHRGHTEIVKILAPLTDNPNAPNEWEHTPIHLAALNGHTEIVKILAPLADNPNAPNDNGNTPIYLAAHSRHTEIIKILAPLTDDPNAPNKWGKTPIHEAALNGSTEIVKILASLTDNPNAPNEWGITPSSVSQNAEIRKVLNLTTLPKNINQDHQQSNPR